jgi:hypothetical protein
MIALIQKQKSRVSEQVRIKKNVIFYLFMKTAMEVVAFPSPGLRTHIPLLSAAISLRLKNSLQPLQCPKHD